MTTILLTGKNGQLGWELQRTLSSLGHVVAFDRATLDLADHKNLRATIQEIKPDLIVNAAAYTAVDKAETERKLATSINTHAPEIMAEEAKKLGSALIHYSTDYVFDGTKQTAYVETDRTNPQNVYGETKLNGELAIQSYDIPHYIFRTSWVYAARGHNFLLSMLRLMQERDSLNIVDDQFGSPTWSRDISSITSYILAQSLDNKGLELGIMKETSGLYHLTSRGRTSWCDFARQILAKCSSQQKEHSFQISGIPSSEYPAPAKRPMNSKLSTLKLNNSFGIICPHWTESLELCIQDV